MRNTFDKPLIFVEKLLVFNAGGAAIPTTAQGRAKVEVIDGGTAVTSG